MGRLQLIKCVDGVHYDTGTQEGKLAFHRAYHNAYAKNNRDKINAIQKKFYEHHPEKRNEYFKKYIENMSPEKKEQRREHNALKAKERYANDEVYRERIKKNNRERYVPKKKSADKKE